MNPPLVLATNNTHKVRELREILRGVPFELRTPREVGVVLDVEETGETPAANALLKATAFAAASGLLTLADDSGLEIDALNGAPGVHSRRFAGPGATDADRIALVLRRMEHVPPEARTARFRCVMCLADPTQPPRLVEGVREGLITFAPRGTGGFGYDPIFLLPELGRTMAELTPDEKNRLSHRALAGQKACALLLRRVARTDE